VAPGCADAPGAAIAAARVTPISAVASLELVAGRIIFGPSVCDRPVRSMEASLRERANEALIPR
jgi:hypothetical protein